MTPKLRFSEFTDDWNVNMLGDIAIFSKGSGISKEDISPGGKYPAIRYGELYTKYDERITKILSYTDISPKGKALSKIEDVIIPASGETHIDIATASCVLQNDVMIGGDINIIRSSNSGTFLAYYLNNKKRTAIACLAQGMSIIHLYPSALKRLMLALPTIGEQQKITTYLTAVDERIAALEQKSEKLHDYKRGVMQKIFSQKIRFTRDDGTTFSDWESKKLSNVFDERLERDGDSKMLSVTISNGIVPFSSIDRKDNSSENKSNYKVVHTGDIAYNTMRMWQGASGLSQEDGIVSPAYTVITPKKDQSGKYWSYRFKTKDAINLFQRWSQGLTSDTWNLKYNALSSLTFAYPCFEEQQRIADFLNAIDEKITLTKSQAAKAKEFKKALLQRMFV